MVTRPNLGFRHHPVLVVGLIALFLSTFDRESASAQQVAPSAEQIIEALKNSPKGKTRSFSAAKEKNKAKYRAFLKSVKKKGTRGLSIDERQTLAEATEDLPSIDLEVYFDFDSDRVSSSSEKTVESLGQALKHPSFGDATFMVAGHTDAKGHDGYNQNLSERRAEAVRRILIDRYALSEDQLLIVGYGEEQLKKKNEPYADVNRRVEVINMGK